MDYLHVSFQWIFQVELSPRECKAATASLRELAGRNVRVKKSLKLLNV